MKLVLVHGFLGSGHNWSPIVQRLEQRAAEISSDLEIFCPDLLGHGPRINVAFGHVDLDRLAWDLDSQIPPGPLTVVAHSFGLRPALRLSSLVPGRIKTLLSEDALPVLEESSFHELSQILGLATAPFESREKARDFFEARFPSNLRLARFLMAQIREIAPGQHGWRFDLSTLQGFLDDARALKLWEEWHDFPGELSLMTGAQSGFTHGQIERAHEHRLPKLLQHIQIEQSGHWIHADQPELFTNELVKLVREKA